MSNPPVKKEDKSTGGEEGAPVVIRRYSARAWTAKEDELLCKFVQKHGVENSWYNVVKFTGLKRSKMHCRMRWNNHLDPNRKKAIQKKEDNSTGGEEGARVVIGKRYSARAWSAREDELLCKFVQKHGVKNSWHNVVKFTGLQRSKMHCRMRWNNHLDPNRKKVKQSRNASSSTPLVLIHDASTNNTTFPSTTQGRSDVFAGISPNEDGLSNDNLVDDSHNFDGDKLIDDLFNFDSYYNDDGHLQAKGRSSDAD